MTKPRSPDRSSPVPWRPLDVVLVALGFGLLAGAVEAAAALVRERILHTTLFMGPELVWQLPLADAAVFLAVGLLFLLPAAVWPRLRVPRIVLALFAGLTLFAALLLTEKIHILAEALLAAGLGLAMARGLTPRSEQVRRLARVVVPVGLLVLGVAGFAQAALQRSGERRALAALSRSAAGHPNILLLVLDTVRAWNLSVYGYGRATTPRLQQWASYGALFERALAPAPWTTLSHAVMFTGRYPTELSVSWRTPYDGAYPTLAGILSDAGYATAGFAGNYLNVGRGTGLARGFLHYEDYPLQAVQLLRSTTMLGRLFRIDRLKELIGRRRMVPGLVGADVNRRFLEWLDGHGEHPWFAFLNYFDAHGPYLPPPPYDAMYIGKADAVVDRYWQNVQAAYGAPPVPLGDLADELDAYDGAINYLDVQVDSLLHSLGNRGQLANTIVVVTSDHGELFGEHGVLGHGNNLFLPVLHVPLLLIARGQVPNGVQVPSPVSLRDLPATLLELAGVRDRRVPGSSLLAGWRSGGAVLPDTLFASLDYNYLIPKWPVSPVLRGPMRSLVLDSLQYIMNGDGLEEFYHLGHDSWEIHNLINLPEYQPDLARYRAALGKLPPPR